MTSHVPVGPASELATRRPFDLLRFFALVVATLIGLCVCYLVALPFLPALVWALAATVLAMPLHLRLERRLKHPTLAASVSLGLLALLVFLPLTFLANELFSVLGAGLASLQEQVASGDLQRFVEAHPLARRAMDLAPAQMDLSAIFGNVTGWLGGLGASAVRGSLTNVIILLLTFYLLFYFLRDHREALEHSRMLSPFTAPETGYLFERVSDTIHAIVFGTVITSAVQGILGGAMFWLLGLPNPLFWGSLMALLSIVPILGAFVVWLPAAAYLALSGDWGKAAALVAWGTIVIGGIDNILHPMLAGGRLRLHTVPTFIAVVGGLALFGASGLILGPLAVVLTLSILQIWGERAHTAGTSDPAGLAADRTHARHGSE